MPVKTFSDALDDCGLWSTAASQRARFANPNFEYLVCRDMGQGIFRGKGKVSLILDGLDLPPTGLELGEAKLCAKLENAWKARLTESGMDTTHVAVSWREYGLSHP
jgi:hypothetical protein